jgi:hypothetical protein
MCMKIIFIHLVAGLFKMSFFHGVSQENTNLSVKVLNKYKPVRLL